MALQGPLCGPFASLFSCDLAWDHEWKAGVASLDDLTVSEDEFISAAVEDNARRSGF